MADTSTSTTSRRAPTTASPVPETVAARAQARYVRVTPMKARRVVDLIRGQQADRALAVLQFAPQSAGEPVYKVLASAVANARYRAEQESRRLDVEDLVVQAAYVDEGPTLKRFRPRAQGRAFRIRKRTSHITVVVAPRDTPSDTPAGRKSSARKSAARNSSAQKSPAKTSTAKKAPAKTSTAKKAPAKKAPAKKTAAKKATSSNRRTR